MPEQNPYEYNEPSCFFFCPADMRPELFADYAHKQVEDMMLQLKEDKNGAWTVVPPPGGIKLGFSIVPLSGVPAGHAYYKDGHETYVVRDQRWHTHKIRADDRRVYANTRVNPATLEKFRACNLLRFRRPRKYQ